jgi:hypothetical protein
MLSILSLAGEKVYEPGTLIDVYSGSKDHTYYGLAAPAFEGSGNKYQAKNKEDSPSYVVVRTDEATYTGFSWSLNGNNWTIGESLEIRIQGSKKFWVRRPNGKEKSFWIARIQKSQRPDD